MNVIAQDVLMAIENGHGKSQRVISSHTGYSLGAINKAIKVLVDEKYIDEDLNITIKSKDELSKCKPSNAIILAAGYGDSTENIPSGLISVNGETLIERMILFLKEVGISDITVVVGYLKEKYEFLIDKYGVEIVVNPSYKTKNNLASLNCVKERICNTYIVPSDIWLLDNPFNEKELYSWYMVTNETNKNSFVFFNRKKELVLETDISKTNYMVGIGYINSFDAKTFKDNIQEISKDPRNDNEFWERALFVENKMLGYGKEIDRSIVREINKSSLCDIDENEIKERIKNLMSIDIEKIKNLLLIKKGPSNYSYSFELDGIKYVIKIPVFVIEDEFKDYNKLYEILNINGLSNEICFFDDNGTVISEYIESKRTCNSKDYKEIIKELKSLHKKNIKCDISFDLFDRIELYEQRRGKKSLFRDYDIVKNNIYSLREYISDNKNDFCLSMIDVAANNFLVTNNDIRMIDLEYAAMQDPLIDLANFCISSEFDKEMIDKVIDFYFDNTCDEKTRNLIYSYIAVCGLMWSNWCECKISRGIDFGEYSIDQYRYAKDYYALIKDII